MEKNKENSKADYNPEVTQEDLDALGKKGLSMDARDDRKLQQRENKVDFTGKDLDVPKGNQTILENNNKIQDEENKFYSQGGERKNNLEERKDN